MHSPSNHAGIIRRHWITNSILSPIHLTARDGFTGDIVTTFPWNTLYPLYGATRTLNFRAESDRELHIKQDIVLIICYRLLTSC